MPSPSPRRAVSTPSWWEAWFGLAAWITLGIQILRTLTLETSALDAVDVALMTVAYLAVGLALLLALARRRR